MAHYPKLCFSLLLLLGAVNYCKSQSLNKIIIPPKECIELNNKGVKYLTKYPDDDKQIDTAINLLSEAVKCDTTYLTGYMNLANAYDLKKSYVDELAVLNKELILTNNNPSILTEKGMLFERMGFIDSANKIYPMAKLNYEKKLAEKPSAWIVGGVVFLKALMNGKDEAIKELDTQLKLHPELSAKLSYLYDFYKDFDRRSFVYRLTIEKSSDAIITK